MNLLVVYLNWLHLEQPPTAPSCAAVGAPISKLQEETVARLERGFAECDTIEEVTKKDLGRSAATAVSVAMHIKRVAEGVESIRAELDPIHGPKTESGEVAGPKTVGA